MGQYFEVDSAGVVHFRQKGTDQLVLEQGVLVPANGITGQIFWKTDTVALKIHDGSSFRSVGTWVDDGTNLSTPSPSRQVQFDAGTVGSPSISFKVETTTGVYRPAAGTIGFSILGGEGARFDSSGNFQMAIGKSVTFVPSSGATPRINSINGEINFVTNSLTRLVVGYTGGVTLNLGAFLAPDGVVGAPSYSYSGATNTGHYRDATFLNSSVGGVTLFRVGSNHVELVNGSAAVPAYSFMNSQASGMYLIGLNQVGFATNGILRAGFFSDGTFQVSDGVVGAPSVSFMSEPTTGIFHSGVNHFNVAVAGTNVIDINAASTTVNIGDIAGNILCYLDYSTNRIFAPSIDDTWTLGTSGNRWSDIWGTTIHSGDIELENKWRITEGNKVGLDKDEVILLSPTGKRFRFLVKEVDEQEGSL